MEFWGVEVKSGRPFSVELEEPRVVHLSQACLGEGKDKGNEPIYLYVTINKKKLVLGTLCPKKFPQLQFDLMFEKDFKLSHSWKNGTVNFFGYECDQPYDDPEPFDSSDYDSDSESGEDIPLQVVHDVNGKPAAQAAKQKVKSAELKDVKEDDDSSDESDADSSEDELDSDENEGGESESSDSETVEDKAEETPKKVEKASKKRPAESASETPGKKAKLVTPKKSGADNKKSNVHVDTPYPSKQAGKTSANQAKQKTPESAGSHSCKPCKRSFKSADALESHSRAKHSDGK